MSKCLYCYGELPGNHDGDYHLSCIKAFFGTTAVPALPYRLDEIEALAKKSVELSVTVPGVQPKISLGWVKARLEDGHAGRLTIMDALEGMYILKPQNSIYPQMPENEDLSMKLAGLFGIRVVPHSLMRMASGELCYITRRIDRRDDGSRMHMIDLQQILELEDKYKGTMEQVGKTIGELSVNTLLDKVRFFELAVFNFIIGNNDMHLKNFSMWLSDFGWILSPAYDLLNVKIILPDDRDDTALMLGGKKRRFHKGYFDKLGNLLGLNHKQINAVYKRVGHWLPDALQLIDASFLSAQNRSRYKVWVVEHTHFFQP